MNHGLHWRWLFLAFASICVAMGVWYVFVAPTILRIAVGPENSPLIRNARAIADALADSRQPFRLKIVVTDGSKNSAVALDANQADIAILSSADPNSKEAQSVALVQRRAVVFLVRQDREIESIADFRGRKIAIVSGSPDSSRPLVERIFAHFRIDVKEMSLSYIGPVDAARVLVEGEADALVLVANPAGRQARRVVRELMDDTRVSVGFLGVPGATALAARFRELQTMEIPAGIFGGSPLHPPRDFDTVAITWELVARASLSEDVVASLARSLMNIRSRLQRSGDSEFIMETPPLDEPRRFVPHAGTASYVNDETKTFLEAWSDSIWLALFGFSILGTSVTGFLAWIGVKPSPASIRLFQELPSELDRLALARSLEEIDAIEKKVDGVIAAFVRDIATGAYDLESQADPGPILRLLPGLLERRRAELRAEISPRP